MAQEKKPSGADSDRVALIMGANRGIGFEIARQLARRGLRVVLGAREANEGKRAATKLAPEGPVVA